MPFRRGDWQFSKEREIDVYRDEVARRILLLGAGFFVAGEIVPRLSHGTVAHQMVGFEILSDPFFSSAALGIYLLYLAQRPPAAQALVVSLLGLGAEGGLYLLRGPGQAHPAWFLGGGMGLVALLGFGWLGRSQPESLRVMETALMCPWVLVMTAWMQTVTTAGHPQVYDLYGWAIDRAWGFEPSAWMSDLVMSRPWLDAIVQGVYNLLPTFVTLAAYLSVRHKGKCYTAPVATVCVVGLCGLLTYWIFPMVGPGPLFGEGFAAAMDAAGPLRLIDAPSTLLRNCMPSLHTAWIVTLYWIVRGVSQRVRVLGFVLVVITLMATLSVGGHYLVDLVVSIPMSAAIMGLTAKAYPGNGKARWMALGVGGGLTALALAALHTVPGFLAQSHGLVAAAEVVFVATGLWLEHRLFRASGDWPSSMLSR